MARGERDGTSAQDAEPCSYHSVGGTLNVIG